MQTPQNVRAEFRVWVYLIGLICVFYSFRSRRNWCCWRDCLQQNGFNKPRTKAQNKYDYSKEHLKSSYEQVPLHTACFTYLGFYLLMILGYINQLFFTPKVATEKHRDVSLIKWPMQMRIIKWHSYCFSGLCTVVRCFRKILSQIRISSSEGLLESTHM